MLSELDSQSILRSDHVKMQISDRAYHGTDRSMQRQKPQTQLGARPPCESRLWRIGGRSISSLKPRCARGLWAAPGASALTDPWRVPTFKEAGSRQLLQLRPITLKQAQHFIHQHHRHNQPPRGGAFAVALLRDDELVGVGIAGRPRSRALQSQGHGLWLEITHICVLESVRNGCTKLYGALKRAGKALGYQKALTYTLVREPGVSPRAAGFQAVTLTADQSWDRPSRERQEVAPRGQKIRWESAL
jgi:hypothetical protein